MTDKEKAIFHKYAQDHYWSSLEKDKDIILKHIGSLLEMAYNELVISLSRESVQHTKKCAKSYPKLNEAGIECTCKPAKTSEFVKTFNDFLGNDPLNYAGEWQELSYKACKVLEAAEKRISPELYQTVCDRLETVEKRLRAMWVGDLSPESRLNGYAVLNRTLQKAKKQLQTKLEAETKAKVEAEERFAEMDSLHDSAEKVIRKLQSEIERLKG